MIRILVADDHKIVRDGLKRILAAAADMEVAAEAANGDEALALVKAGNPARAHSELGRALAAKQPFPEESSARRLLAELELAKE